MPGDRITRIEGILNGTCNFILSKMDAGDELAPVLKEAQALGYAEADPTEDVAGFDARANLVIFSRIALRADMPVSNVPTKSISEITAIDFDYARQMGCTIRQISRAELRHNEVLATVGPMLVPQSSPLAWSRGTENMVMISGEYGGKVVFSGHGAGGNPTAVAVVSDLVAIAHKSCPIDLPSKKVSVSGDFLLRHYIRFVVKDRPGIIAQIAGALAEQEINIHAVLQKPGYTEENLPFVVIVEPCPLSALKRALEKISKLDCLLEPTLDLQILEPDAEV